MSKSSGGLCGQQNRCGKGLPSRVQKPETHLFLGRDNQGFQKQTLSGEACIQSTTELVLTQIY